MKVISRKITPPPIPEGMIRRARLDDHLARLIATHRAVIVAAMAGAGKTTATVSACAQLRRPVVWLAVDRTDGAPGRLVTYLEAAIARVLPGLNAVATNAMGGGIPHPEASGLLAEAVYDARLVVVLDDLERLADSEPAWAVIEAFVRYAPAGVTTVLLSRRDIPAELCELPLAPESVVVTESELAFTAAEAGQALSSGGATELDAGRLEKLLLDTGGWVAGVMFAATSAGLAAGAERGSATYLPTRVLAQLEQRDRDFLLRTAVLEEVGIRGAAALGISDAAERLASLRAAHLPASWRHAGLCMRLHGLIREHLLELQERRDPSEMRALRLAAAGLLTEQGHDEEAVEMLLRCDALEDALAPATRAIARVIERLDYGVADRWLTALASVTPPDAEALHRAELMLAVGRGEFARGAAVGDRLARAGERDRLVTSSDRAAGLLAYCYGEVGRLADMQAIVDLAPSGPSIDVLRYTGRLTLGDRRLPRPAPTGGPLDALLLAVDYGLGRLEHMAVTGSRWTTAVHTPYRISALRAMGCTQEALALYFEAAQSGAIEAGFAAFVGTDLFVDAGRREEALAALEEGRAFLNRNGSRIRWLLSCVAEARMALRLDRHPETALDALAVVERALQESPVVFIRDSWGAWKGFALLLAGRLQEALATLRPVVASMVEGDRMLDLPTAAVYLAEAEWRAGEEVRADQAADVALAAAGRQGSDHLLLQALGDFPAVVSRQIDAQRSSDSSWHALGRALLARRARVDVPVGPSLEFRDLGRPRIIVDGVPQHPRIAKAYELLAFLTSRPACSATREELLDALFNGRDDASTRAYLRQAITQLARALPDKDAVASTDGVVSLLDQIAISTTTQRCEQMLAEARARQGADRLDATLEALELLGDGDYLERAEGMWIDSRRRQLRELASSARGEAARLAFELGRHLEASELNGRVLADDPMREDAWRLEMEIRAALGDYAGVLAAFGECSRALSTLGAGPAASTRELLGRLRR